MDLSLLIFTLFSSPFCMKSIEFTTRTYNFKNWAVGSWCVTRENKDRKTGFRHLASKIPRSYACIAPILKAGCIRIPKWCRAPIVYTHNPMMLRLRVRLIEYSEYS
jgi:hypothetical protein